MNTNLKKNEQSKGSPNKNMCYLMGREIFCRCFEKAKLIVSEKEVMRGWKVPLAQKLSGTKSWIVTKVNEGITSPDYIKDRFDDVWEAINLNRLYDKWAPNADCFSPLIEYAGFSRTFEKENERLKTLELAPSVKKRLTGFFDLERLLAEARIADAQPEEVRAICTNKPLSMLAFPSEVTIRFFADGKTEWIGEPKLILNAQHIKSVARYEMTGNEIASWVKLEYSAENKIYSIYLTEIDEELIDGEFYRGPGSDKLYAHFEKILESGNNFAQ